jgi:NADH pyrophosphatase NudC (nudix superfamily)
MTFGQKILDITHHLILPVFVLFTISLAGLQRQMRANMLDVLDSDYVKFARAKGLPESVVIYKHALRNAVNPMMNAGQQIATTMSENGWNCACGATNIQTPFCPQCGNKKVEAAHGWDCACGAKNIQTPFCPQCGSKKVEAPQGWDCACGAKNIQTPFCPQCGSKKVEAPQGWDCACGEKNVQTPFCPVCGTKKEE